MTYTPEQVERLLPTVWGRAWAWGMQNPQAHDPDMPRASSVASHAGTYWTHLADISSAWHKTLLTRELRVALFLTHACGWTQDEIAEHEQVSQRAISKRLTRGLELLTNYLNNGTIHTEEAANLGRPRAAVACDYSKTACLVA